MSLRSERRDGTHLVLLSGEIDLENARALEAEILSGMDDAQALVVDLSDVSYFDSSGMRMLDALAGACDAAGVPLRVVAPDGGRARFILRIVAWPEALLAGSLDTALAALAR